MPITTHQSPFIPNPGGAGTDSHRPQNSKALSDSSLPGTPVVVAEESDVARPRKYSKV
ncbi:MAG: hypothetical protein ACM65M_24145 [Microcoleus sp.]